MEIKIQDIIIAFDGHSSCGKSTVAKAVAKEIGYTYIDSVILRVGKAQLRKL